MDSREFSTREAAGRCEAEDLTRGWKGVFLWCVPIAAVIAGIGWTRAQTWLWIGGFLVMGIACVANAARCGRVHCYICGPLFLLSAVYVALTALHAVPMYRRTYLNGVSIVVVLACLAEGPAGKYRRKS
jgi:hypothetical protein